MKNSKIRSILGLIGFLTLIFAISLAIWKYSGAKESFDDVITKVKTNNLMRKNSSDLDIKIGYDKYIGYSILESKRFRRDLESLGISITLDNDNANYSQRFAKLIEGKIDMAVMPIHDYIQQLSLMQKKDEKIPLIIAAISESRGSDAVVANPKKFPNIDALKGMKKIKAAYTSQFMLGSMAIDANVPLLLNKRGIDANPDIQITYDGLLSGRYDVVGLWEPYITKAKERGFVVLMDSAELKLGKIIDVIVLNQSFLANHKNELQTFLKTYYESVEYFNQDIPSLVSEIEIKQGGDLNKVDISSSLKTVKLYTLNDNAFNLFKTNSNSSEKILDYIDAIAIKLKKMTIIEDNPIKNSDSRNIVYTGILSKVFNSYPAGSISKPHKEDKSYISISNKTWEKLIKDPKFTRDDLKITFLRDGRLNSDAKNTLDDFAQNSINNFDYYIAIVGRSGKARGVSEQKLVKRTEKKAQMVYDYLTKYWSIDKNRLHPLGLGSKGIKPHKKGENYYQYLNKNNKVELLFIDY